MKKIIYVIVFLLNYSNIFSQNIEKINNNNIAFIYFDKEDDNFKKTKDVFIVGKIKEYGEKYNYLFLNRYKKHIEISFIHNKYKDFDSFDNKEEMLSFKLCKSFLKNNKDIIINNETIKKIGLKGLYDIILDKQKVFLIDKSEIENNLILVKEVYLLDLNSEE
ncbi:hypothetical protein V1T75_16300 [Tenacibaculum sp. FZY0031]|uniref:hypothetical protein n=1 Tax=Tenacibaculum sp. FZY0031 TaxID=3116648 RepID=UPI002ECE8603|nr:hypothetical protein [Tenacibaculum sp. FZY0031]